MADACVFLLESRDFQDIIKLVMQYYQDAVFIYRGTNPPQYLNLLQRLGINPKTADNSISFDKTVRIAVNIESNDEEKQIIYKELISTLHQTLKSQRIDLRKVYVETDVNDFMLAKFSFDYYWIVRGFDGYYVIESHSKKYYGLLTNESFSTASEKVASLAKTYMTLQI